MGENRGFVGNVNAGLEHIKDDDILLSNDDVVVLTPEWVARVEEHLQHASTAAVGATSNYVLSHQLSTRKGSSYESVPYLSFFWCALSRKALDDVGHLDEDFELGLCDDLDWSIRACGKGWDLVLDRRIYVHHWGSQTIQQLCNMDEQEKKNRALLKEKHPGTRLA